MSSQHPVNRRQMLRLATGASAAALLAACGGSSAPAAPKIGGSTSAPVTGVATNAPAGSAASGAASAPTGVPNASTMYMLNDKTFSDVGGRDATAAYNQEHPTPPTVRLEDAADGWDAKVLPQIKDKSLRWSGSGYIPFFDQYTRLKAGIVAPLDEYLSASKVPWAHQQKDVYFTPRIYEAQLLDGKQYYIPMKANVHLERFAKL